MYVADPISMTAGIQIQPTSPIHTSLLATRSSEVCRGCVKPPVAIVGLIVTENNENTLLIF